ncbi:MAG TPA: (Fe-S)-binding protein [Verrucomicrobiae bacterium]|nr:(Fe-S)-binding protein [Verrucomicrobiae bacterium]
MKDYSLLQKEIDQCSRCGGCLAVCPIYGELGIETMGSRARVFLFSQFLEGKLEFSEKLAEIMSLCLLCKNCSATCPNGVATDKLVLAARKEAVDKYGLSLIKRNVFRHLLPNNERLNLAASFLRMYQRTGLRWVMRKSRLLKIFPGDLAAKEHLLPDIQGNRPFRMEVPKHIPVDKPQGRVAYFTGCMTNFFYQNTGRSLLNVLKHNNIEVFIPEQTCCGVPAEASGDVETALKLAEANVKAFAALEVDAVITDCPSCGMALKEFGEKLGTEEAKALSAKVRDITQYLMHDIKFKPPQGSQGISVTYHDPCHACRGLMIQKEPREMLKSIPGLQIKEMAGSNQCCGGAGSFNLSHYKLSMQILAKKLKSINDTQAEVVATACPACEMQLGHGVRKENMPQRVVHPIELLSQAYGVGN